MNTTSDQCTVLRLRTENRVSMPVARSDRERFMEIARSKKLTGWQLFREMLNLYSAASDEPAA